MKTIYHLREDRERIANTQAASLSAKPFGLKPVNGLFASDEWWHNFDVSVIPVIRYAGTITRLFRSGMHNESECFEIVSPDGQTFQYDCVALNRRDRKLYKVGAYVELAFVRQELKQPFLTTAGDIYDTHARCLIETPQPISYHPRLAGIEKHSCLGDSSQVLAVPMCGHDAADAMRS